MCRYSGAVHRYLLKALKDPDAAAELDQEFAVRFLRGDFQGVDPDRGRFRDYVKRAVQNLINDYYRKRPKRVVNSRVEDLAVDDAGLALFEQQFLESWPRTYWTARGLRFPSSKNSGQPYHTVLRSRVDHADLPSPELAKQLSTTLGRPLTAGAVRQALQRSRRKYVDYLLTEVLMSLDQPTQEDLEEELSDLNLLDYCRPVSEAAR